MALRLCIIVESFCSQVRNIFPHMSLRDLPCHRTKRYCFCIRIPWNSDRQFFFGSSRNLGFEHISVICHNILADLTFSFPRTETIRSHNSKAGKPSNLSPVSNEIISDSVELWETAVCFLHIQLNGTNVWLLKTHNIPPEVDFESSRSPAKSESWNSPSLHCLAVLPTWQYCLYSRVWWIFWNQSIQAFVTGFGPFRNRSCKFSHWP